MRLLSGSRPCTGMEAPPPLAVVALGSDGCAAGGSVCSCSASRSSASRDSSCCCCRAVCVALVRSVCSAGPVRPRRPQSQWLEAQRQGASHVNSVKASFLCGPCQNRRNTALLPGRSTVDSRETVCCCDTLCATPTAHYLCIGCAISFDVRMRKTGGRSGVSRRCASRAARSCGRAHPARSPPG